MLSLSVARGGLLGALALATVLWSDPSAATEPVSCGTEASAIRAQIDALNAQFAYLIDHGRGVEAAALFTSEGVYETAPGSVLTGRDAIREAYVRRAQRGVRTSSHIFTNLHILSISDDARTVEATTILLLFAEDGSPPHAATPLGVADFNDVLVCETDGAWRYQSRRVTPLFDDVSGRQPVMNSSPH